MKLNFDAAIGDEKTSIALVCRDDKGVLLMAWAEQIDPGSPILGEQRQLYVQLEEQSKKTTRKL